MSNASTQQEVLHLTYFILTISVALLARSPRNPRNGRLLLFSTADGSTAVSVPLEQELAWERETYLIIPKTKNHFTQGKCFTSGERGSTYLVSLRRGARLLFLFLLQSLLAKVFYLDSAGVDVLGAHCQFVHESGRMGWQKACLLAARSLRRELLRLRLRAQPSRLDLHRKNLLARV